MDSHNEPISRQQHRSSERMGTGKWVLAGMLLAGIGAAGWYFYQQSAISEPPPVVEPAAPVVTPEANTTAIAEPVQALPVPPEPLQEHPIEPASDHDGKPPLDAQDASSLAAATTDWLGANTVQRWIATDNLAQRVVATIDNLPRKLVASRLWPLHPVGGKMVVHQTDDGGMQIAPENAARYDGVVGFVNGIDAAQAAAFYRRVYPVLQHAYEDLGYPGQRFNDRLVASIDHLLSTPEPEEPLRLQLVQVQGQVASQYPWLRYEFVDSRLQSLSAGQKILVRMGVPHTQRIKAQLRALRAQITQR